MKKSFTQAALTLAIALSLPAVATADPWYLSTQVGVSEQINDSEAYGNNIAVDPDFPATFDAGDGEVLAIGLGYRINPNWRIEGRLGYRDSNFNPRRFGRGLRAGEEYILDGEVNTRSLTVEGIYDIDLGSAWTPYLKAGVGVANNRYAARLGGAGISAFDAFDGTADGYYDNYADGDSSEFSWNLGTGVSVQLLDQLSVYGEYQYSRFGDVSTAQDAFTDGFKLDAISTHELMIGLRFSL